MSERFFFRAQIRVFFFLKAHAACDMLLFRGDKTWLTTATSRANASICSCPLWTSKTSTAAGDLSYSRITSGSTWARALVTVSFPCTGKKENRSCKLVAWAQINPLVIEKKHPSLGHQWRWGARAVTRQFRFRIQLFAKAEHGTCEVFRMFRALRLDFVLWPLCAHLNGFDKISKTIFGIFSSLKQTEK